MKKKSDEMPATFSVNLPGQVQAGEPTTVYVKVTQPRVKEYWRDPKAVQGAVKVDRWCPPLCYAVAQTIIDQYGSLHRFAAETPLPSMNFRPEVLEMVDLLILAFIGPEGQLVKRAQNAEEERQNKLREKLLLANKEPTLPPPVLADDALVQIKHALCLALEPYFSKVEVMEAERRSAQSQLHAKDLQIEQLQTEHRQLSQQHQELHNNHMKLVDYMLKALHDLEVIKSYKDQRAWNQQPPERGLFKLGRPAKNNKGEQEPTFVDLKLVATYRYEAMELIRRYQTDPDLIRSKKAANE